MPHANMRTFKYWKHLLAVACACSMVPAAQAADTVRKPSKEKPHAAAKKSGQATVAKRPSKAEPKMARNVPNSTLSAKAAPTKSSTVARLSRRAEVPSEHAAALSLGSASALVLDAVTGSPVLQKNSGAVVPIASISKLMTAMVVLDANLPMDEAVTIGQEDVDMLKGSHSRLPVGATMSRETAMLLALMSSDNRAAHALARHYPGGLQAFVQAMNEKARSLGMTESRFLEPTGLSSNNVSTAHDLARMVMAASKYNKIRELSTTADARIQIGNRQLEFHNTNALVRGGTWDIGLSKTGYISEAGRCLVMQAKVAERPVVIVLLDAAGKMTRIGDAQRIKRWMEQASIARETRPA